METREVEYYDTLGYTAKNIEFIPGLEVVALFAKIEE